MKPAHAFLSRAALLIAVLLGPTGASNALNISELYRTHAIVTGTGEVNRRLGFAACLREVLVKVSGDRRLLRKAALQAILDDAGSLIESYDYRDRMEGIPIHDEQGTYDRPHDLTCTFEHTRIDALLDRLGSKPWLEERPHLLAFLSVRNGPKVFLLSRDGVEGPYMRDSLAAAAEPFAVHVALPDSASLHADAIGSDSLAGRPVGDLTSIASRYGGAIPLVGTLTWSDRDLGWVATWRLLAQDQEFKWQLRGVSFDDAFRDAIGGVLQIMSGNGAP